MTNDFDLAVYIKGDRKPTALFSARLELSWEGENPPVEEKADFEITEYGVSQNATLGESVTIYWTVVNNGPLGALGSTNAKCKDTRNLGVYVIDSTSLSLEVGSSKTFEADLFPPSTVDNKPMWIQCTLTTQVTSKDIVDPIPENNKVAASDFKFLVKK
eukprot:scaffold3066_cov178-Amphora_coffeaeformis.AAC.5